MKKQPSLSEVRAQMQEVTEMLRQIAEDPSKLDGFSDVQLAWLMEHLEMLRNDSLDLKVRIEKITRPAPCPQCGGAGVALDLDEILDWWRCPACSLDFSTLGQR